MADPNKNYSSLFDSLPISVQTRMRAAGVANGQTFRSSAVSNPTSSLPLRASHLVSSVTTPTITPTTTNIRANTTNNLNLRPSALESSIGYTSTPLTSRLAYASAAPTTPYISPTSISIPSSTQPTERPVLSG
jgi:hypothetical protein